MTSILLKMASKTGRLQDSLRRINLVCKVSGLDLENRKRNYIQKLVYLNNFFWLNFDVAGAICYIIYGMFHGKDFIELTYAGPCVTLSLLANFKSLSIIRNGDKLKNLFNILRKLENHEEGDESPTKRRIIQEEVNFLHVLMRVLNVSYVILATMFSVGPLIVTAYIYFVNNEVDLRLPLYILYPFDAYELKYWPWVFLHQSWSGNEHYKTKCIVCSIKI